MLIIAANYGFPAVIAVYVLARMEPLIRDLQKTVACLTAVVAKQADMDLEDIERAFNGNR